jgi:hypothetical protein
VNPKNGKLHQPEIWNGLGTDGYIYWNVSPDKNSVLSTNPYEKMGVWENDLMVYDLRLELVTQKTIKSQSLITRWLDNEHIIYFNNIVGANPPIHNFYIWNPFTNQLLERNIPVNYFNTQNKDIVLDWGGPIYDPSLTYVSYLTPHIAQPLIFNLKTQKKVWSYEINNLAWPPVWSPDGTKQALLVLDNNKLLLDILTLDGKIQRWVEIGQKKGEPWYSIQQVYGLVSG